VGRRRIDDVTFAQAAEEHLDDVYGYLVYLTHDRSLAEELTGDAFERALRLWSRYDARKGSVKTWLCQVARTTALDHFRAEKRRRRREAEYALGERATEEAPLAEGLSPELERALASLSPAEREVIALRVLLELDGPAAARVLGISPTALSTRLSRALNRLEEALRVAA
jgi:RNA polymerase sigma-70 factor (ECF subfamily)